MNFGVAQISAITVICYLAASIVKSSPVNNKWIPAICGGLGGIISIVGFFIIPDYPAENLFAAISMGIVSGFAATGVNQAYKQITHGESSDSRQEEEEDRDKTKRKKTKEKIEAEKTEKEEMAEKTADQRTKEKDGNES